MSNKSKFISLHNHSEYSLLDGAIKISEMIDKAKNNHMSAVALTDHGNLYGSLDFYMKAKKAGIKPIIGCEVYVAPESMEKKEPGEDVRSGYHLVLLAKNNTGLSNLLKVCSEASLNGVYYKPRVDKKLLRDNSNGLIALSGCLAGEVSKNLLLGKRDEALIVAKEYSEIFKDNFYLEVQANELSDQEIVNREILALSRETGIPMVATNDCHYLNKEDKELHDALLCVQTNSKVFDEKRMKSEGALHFKTPDEMYAYFSEDFVGALKNSVEIAEQCEISYDLDNYKFPAYTLEHGNSLDEEFDLLAKAGLRKKITQFNIKDESVYWDRLEYELSTIKEMGFPGYFLIVQDFINWAKEKGIPVGPGRGSAAGSLVAYSLGITNIDPLPYNLLFERFLNKERISMPDIDVDFCEKRRDEVIKYVSDKYGEDSVAQITTFGSMKTKGAVRDIGRALGFSFVETDQICKMIPEQAKSLSQARESEDIRRLCETYEGTNSLLDLAEKAEGMLRHASVHAAGLVIGDKPLVEYVPLYRGKNGEVVSQYDMNMLEKIGLIKFDFLGLKTITVIQNAVDMIEKNYGQKIDIDLIPLNDANVFETYANGFTDGLFQVESAGMKKYLKQMKPDCFEDIIAMLALYRPGPLGSGMVDEFIMRKNGELETTYLFPELEEVLQPTYGVILYQEQVMQIAQVLAGYTLGQADILRKAMGKKKADVMEKEKVNFIQGGVKNGYPEDKVKEIFEQIEKFAEYGFNKSHSTAYAMISYQTAYLKTYYPKEFMAALLTSDAGNHDKLMVYIADCKRMDIEIDPPDINQSVNEFNVVDGKIKYGLGALKSIGENSINKIINERNKKGSFLSFYDFVKRTNSSKKIMEALIYSGGTDTFNKNRNLLFSSIPEITDLLKKEKKRKEKYPGQLSLLSVLKDKKPKKEIDNFFGIGIKLKSFDVEEWEEFEKLSKEKEYLGVYLSSHPLFEYQKDILNLDSLSSVDFCENKAKDENIIIPCLISSVTNKIDKKKRKMAFLEIEDLTKTARVVVFSSTYEDCKELLKENNLIVISGKVGDSLATGADKLNIIANKIEELPVYIKNDQAKVEEKQKEKDKENKYIDGKRNSFLKKTMIEQMNHEAKNTENEFSHCDKEEMLTEKKDATSSVQSNLKEKFCEDEYVNIPLKNATNKEKENFDNIIKEKKGKCYLKINPDYLEDLEKIEGLKDLLLGFRGKTPLVIVYSDKTEEGEKFEAEIELHQRHNVHFCRELKIAVTRYLRVENSTPLPSLN